MGFLYLFISLIAGAVKGYFGKRVSGVVVGIRGAARTNLVRMLLSTAISLLLLLTGFEQAGLLPDLPAIIIGTGAGVLLSTFTITWLLGVQHGAYVLFSVAQMFGVVVTLLCSMAVFGTQPTTAQYLGVGLLIIAVLVVGSYSKQLKGGLSMTAILLLVLCGLSSGLYDFSLKLFTYYSASSKSMMNLLTYLVSAGILGIVVMLPQKKPVPQPVSMKQLFFPIFLMAVCMFLNSYFKAFSTEFLSDAQLYPIYQAGSLILSALMSTFFFKERVTWRCAVGLVLAFAAILLLK